MTKYVATAIIDNYKKKDKKQFLNTNSFPIGK